MMRMQYIELNMIENYHYFTIHTYSRVRSPIGRVTSGNTVPTALLQVIDVLNDLSRLCSEDATV